MTYVAKTSIQHGVGNDVLNLKPGDKLPEDKFDEDQIEQLLEADAIEKEAVDEPKAKAASATPAKAPEGTKTDPVASKTSPAKG